MIIDIWKLHKHSQKNTIWLFQLQYSIDWTQIYNSYHKSGWLSSIISFVIKNCSVETNIIRMPTTSLFFILDFWIFSTGFCSGSFCWNEGTGINRMERSAREVLWLQYCTPLYNMAREGMMNTIKQIEVVAIRTPYFQLRLKIKMLTTVANL